MTKAEPIFKHHLTKARHPSLVFLADTFQLKHQAFKNSVARGYEFFGEAWADDFEKILTAVFPTPQSIINAAKGYADFSIHSMRLQAAFDREKKYKIKTYEQAANEVYFNEDYMLQEYLPGLLLSHFLWPHHYRQIEFFKTAFARSMNDSAATSFLEVGIGTGLYSGILLRLLPETHGTGLDISQHSKKFTENQLLGLGVANRYNIELRDLIANPLEKQANWLVCVEVLEHLENPINFLHGLRRSLKPNAKAFITAAINSAHTDHIYLYRKSDDVLAHLIEAGFTLEQSFTGTAYKTSNPGVPAPQVAAFIVY